MENNKTLQLIILVIVKLVCLFIKIVGYIFIGTITLWLFIFVRLLTSSFRFDRWKRMMRNTGVALGLNTALTDLWCTLLRK